MAKDAPKKRASCFLAASTSSKAPQRSGTGEAAGKGDGEDDEGEGVRRCDGRREGKGRGTR